MTTTTTETAKLLSLSVSMISKLIELGELRAFSTSDRAGKTLIPRTELVRYIDSRVATRKRQYPKRMRAS